METTKVIKKGTKIINTKTNKEQGKLEHGTNKDLFISTEA